jgi:HAD superfamily hydrolase (TIGR01450 family)
MVINMQSDLLKKIKLFVLDMDGTFYLGNKIIDGSLEFLKEVKDSGRDFLFFTNNSSKAPQNYIEKLAGMNCVVERKDIMTSGDVTIEYLQSHYANSKVYLLGTKELEQSFLDAGIWLTDSKPDIVVVGFDMTLTYEKLEKACTFIRNGAKFIATHLDINCPTEEGFIPDCGAISAAIKLSTGVEPEFMGKPFEKTVDMIVKRTHYEKDEIAFVGDRLYTDDHAAGGCSLRDGNYCAPSGGRGRQQRRGGGGNGGSAAGKQCGGG